MSHQSVKINKGHYRRFNIFKCQTDKCCNFISTVMERQMYCKMHEARDIYRYERKKKPRYKFPCSLLNIYLR